ncbi:MAG: recombination protein O N-terminal domain-containing protein, partial [Pseudomonadota bacterium]|nr:recombination protein O N-terminal domain-containing protein [Pseudomonadota bacterium]
MNDEWLNAYVLHRRPYRETSYIVDFFTLEEGRISAVAKGVKNSKSDKKSL